MARIRTVKPELWSDENFIECSLSARLFFVASLNFASDYGVLPDKPRTLAMQCMPGDNVDPGALIEELVSAHFYLREVTPDGAKVLVIRTFGEHQRVNRPTAGRWGDPKKWGKSDPETDTPHGGLTEDSLTEGKGREGKGREKEPLPHLRDTQTEPVDNSERRRQVIDHECKQRRQAMTSPVTSETGLKRSMTERIEAEHGTEIDRIVREYPTATYDVIAAAAIHGEKRSLQHHQRIEGAA